MSREILKHKLTTLAALIDCTYDFTRIEFIARKRRSPKGTDEQSIINDIYYDFVESFMY